MKDHWYIDNTDIFESFGVGITKKGFNDLFLFPSLKDPDYNDWPEYDGIEVDLSNPVLNNKTVKVTFASLTSDNDNIDNFYLFIGQAGYRELNIKSLGRTWKLRLRREPNRDTYRKAQIITVEFADDFPVKLTGIASGHGFNLPESPYLLGEKRLNEYGLIVNKGKASVYAVPDLKKNLQINSKYNDGLTYDTQTVVYSSKEVKLKCSFLCDTIGRFWNNYDAFFSDLVAPDLRLLEVEYMYDVFKCYYKNSSDFNFVMHTGYILCEFTLTLVFTDFRPKLIKLLITEDKEYFITTEDGFRILI